MRSVESELTGPPASSMRLTNKDSNLGSPYAAKVFGNLNKAKPVYAMTLSKNKDEF